MSPLRTLLAASAGALVAAGTALAAPVVTRAPVATDVTDRSFAVVWEADTPVRGALRLFADANGATPVTASEGILSEGASFPAAELQGTVRVRARGFAPQAVVYYQTETISLVDASVTLWPAAPPFPSVTLQTMAGWPWFGPPRPPANDLVEVAVAAAGGAGPAPGALVLVDVTGNGQPVSAFVGEAGTLDAAVVDLNGLYDELELFGYAVQGGETAQITVIGGQRGSATASATLDTPTGFVQIVPLLAGPLELPNAAPACSNGFDDDGDGRVDRGLDPGCASHTDTSERQAGLVCDDGLDNDGESGIDFPSDPGCLDPSSPLENPQCSDDVDNDNDGKIDYDGGPGGGTPDPQCSGAPWRNREAASGGCGLGFELAVLLPGLWLLRARARRRSEVRE